LRDFLFERIYLAQSAAEQKVKIHRLIAGLFQYYLTNPDHLPEQFRNGSGEDLQLLVADYIAGMTDRYALAEFEKLFLPKAWSL
jgi:dGTPase